MIEPKKIYQVVIMNGLSGSGKDTSTEYNASAITNKYGNAIKMLNINSVEFIKEMLIENGCWDGIKDERGRTLLMDVKAALDKYDNVPNKKIIEKIKDEIWHVDNQTGYLGEIFWVHIREPRNIEHLRSILKDEIKGIIIYTNVITREGFDAETKDIHIGDKDVFNYEYDYINNIEAIIWNNEDVNDHLLQDKLLEPFNDTTFFALPRRYNPTPGRVRDIVKNIDTPSQVGIEVNEALEELQKRKI